MRVLVTRPEADALELKTEIEALGHEVTVAPLLQIEFLGIDPAAFEGAQAIAVTSRNGLQALAASGSPGHALKLPLFAVGPATAACAQAMGFAKVFTGSGTASDLVPLIASQLEASDGPIIYLAGEDLAFDLTAPLKERGLEAREIVSYRAHTISSFAPETTRLIAEGHIDAAILMSRRTAAFCQAVNRAGLEESARKLTCLCISQSVAEELGGLDLCRIEVASKPNSAEILTLLAHVATGSPSV